MCSNERLFTKTARILLSLAALCLMSEGGLAQAADSRSVRSGALSATPVSRGEIRTCEPSRAGLRDDGAGAVFRPAAFGPGGRGAELALLANVGEKLWDLVVNNQRPMGVDFQRVRAHALPKGISEPRDISPWCGTSSTSFALDYTNLLGLSLFRAKIGVHFLYGAPYRGTGKYLANVTVEPEDIHAKLGFSTHARVRVADPVYLAGGVVSMLVSVELNVRGPVDDVTVTQVFDLRGDGKIVRLSAGERVAEGDLRQLKIAYDDAITSAANTGPGELDAVTACIDRIFGEWENGYFSAMRRTLLKKNQMEQMLQDYGSFMANRLRDAELREEGRRGLEDLVEVEIRGRRGTRVWPDGSAVARVAVGAPLIAELNQHLKPCFHVDFLNTIMALLPAADLGRGGRPARRYTVNWRQSEAGGVEPVVTKQEERS